MSTALSIKGKTVGGDGVTSTINYVNPNATDEQLTSLATAFNDLTTNTVTDITRIDKNSLTASTKLDRNMKLIRADTSAELTTIAFTDLPTTIDQGINPLTVQCDGEFSLSELALTKNITGTAFIFCDWYDDGGGANYVEIVSQKVDQSDTASGTLTFSLPATDIYKASSVTVTIT